MKASYKSEIQRVKTAQTGHFVSITTEYEQISINIEHDKDSFLCDDCIRQINLLLEGKSPEVTNEQKG